MSINGRYDDDTPPAELAGDHAALIAAIPEMWRADDARLLTWIQDGTDMASGLYEKQIGHERSRFNREIYQPYQRLAKAVAPYLPEAAQDRVLKLIARINPHKDKGGRHFWTDEDDELVKDLDFRVDAALRAAAKRWGKASQPVNGVSDMPRTELHTDLDIQVLAHVLANPALYKQAGKDIDETYSPQKIWEADIQLYKAQAGYPPERYPTLEQWQSPARRMAEQVLPSMLQHYQADRGIPPADEAARVVLVHWILTYRACHTAPVKLTEFQNWSKPGGADHELMRSHGYDRANNTEWREYVYKSLAVMQSQSAMADANPVPAISAITHDASAALTLKDPRQVVIVHYACEPMAETLGDPRPIVVVLRDAMTGRLETIADTNERALLTRLRDAMENRAWPDVVTWNMGDAGPFGWAALSRRADELGITLPIPQPHLNLAQHLWDQLGNDYIPHGEHGRLYELARLNNLPTQDWIHEPATVELPTRARSVAVKCAAIGGVLRLLHNGKLRYGRAAAKGESAKPKQKRKRRRAATEPKALTDRERQAVELAAEGHGPTEIGRRMGVTKSTAATLRDKGKKKLVDAIASVNSWSSVSVRPTASIKDVQYSTKDD